MKRIKLNLVLLFIILSSALQILTVQGQDQGADVATAEKDESGSEESVVTSDAVEEEQQETKTGEDAELDSDDEKSEDNLSSDINDSAEQKEEEGEAKVAETETEQQKTSENANEAATEETSPEPPKQSGPFIDLLGDTLLSLQMVDETHAQLNTHYTNEVLHGKKIIGLYFSADWCGPCKQFTPELVSFYNKINSRKGKQNTFEIVWVSRCRDVKSFGQYFTHMNWLALPPEEALGARGQELFTKYKGKGIPHLVLLDELGSVITLDARSKIPQDKAGIGFPWRNPFTTLYITLVPKSLRFVIKSHVHAIKEKIKESTSGILAKVTK